MFQFGAPALPCQSRLHRAMPTGAPMTDARKIVIVGCGVVGLESASSAAELGIKTSVMEIAPRILARVCDEETSALIHERHRRAGVDIRLGTAATALRPLPEGGFEVDTNTGMAIKA